MPVSRSPVRSVSGIPYHGYPASRNMGMSTSATQCSSVSPSTAVAHDISTPPRASLPARRRRTPNAFILYRSYIIANRMYPTELNHQSDVSRHVAEMWETLTPSERCIFFEMAEEKRRTELESHGEEPYKKRRSRSRKSNATRDGSCVGESSPASSDGCPLPSSPMPVSSSPPSTFVPSLDSLALPPHDAFASPLPPQARHPIPSHLFNWGQEMDNTSSGELRPNELESAWLSSSLPMPFQVPYQSDAAFFDSLDVETLDFQLPLNTSTNFTSTLYNLPIGLSLTA